VTRAEYDRLLEKLRLFANQLSANEQLALARILDSAHLSRITERDDFPGEAWQEFSGIMSNNGGGKS